MTKQHFQFVVIGSGPAGRRAAIQAAKVGKSVLVIEKGRSVGGVSVHTGTIPSKTLRETVLNLSGWRERGFYGRAYRVKNDIVANDLKRRLHQTLTHEVDVLVHQFARNNVKMMHGHAQFISPNQVEVITNDGRSVQVSFDKAIICVGTRPFRPQYIPFDGKYVIDSDEILDIERLPKSLTIIGAGVIGIEYATIFSALDVAVTLIEPRNKILDFVDNEIVTEFLHDLRDRGMQLRLGCEVAFIERQGERCRIGLKDGRVLSSEMVIFAAGRIGATHNLNLDKIGLTTDHRGRISVHNDTYQTNLPNIYAVGDVIGFPSLASTSMEQGRIAACHALGITANITQKQFPYGIYAVPEISTIGKNEAELIAEKIPYEIGIARFRETSRGHIMGLEGGMMKLLFSLETRQLLGVHVLGEGATELVHIGQAVLNLGGKIDFFLENVFNYPTLAEAYKIAALDAWNRMSLAGEFTPVQKIHSELVEKITAKV